MKGKIYLGEIKFHAYHGVLEEEQMIGAKYGVIVELMIDMEHVVISDDLKDTLDYSKVYDLIKEEFKVRSKLIEHVGGRILSRLISTDYPEVKWAKVRVNKYKPPVDGDLPVVSIELEKEREE